jgi:hypothetical protein
LEMNRAYPGKFRRRGAAATPGNGIKDAHHVMQRRVASRSSA